MIPLYESSDTTAVIPAEEYIARYRDTERFIAYCRNCDRYGACWTCPPFGPGADACLSDHRTVLLVGTRILPDPALRRCREAGRCREIGREMLGRERARLDPLLLEWERNDPGSRAFFAGTCHLCPTEGCTRREGLPCRHPGLIRPSLEAFGFDIGRTASELLHIELKWSRDGLLPEYFTLVSGVFSDRKPEEITWNRA